MFVPLLFTLVVLLRTSTHVKKPVPVIGNVPPVLRTYAALVSLGREGLRLQPRVLLSPRWLPS